MDIFGKVKQYCAANTAVGEGLVAVKYELLRKTGVAVCNSIHANVIRFMPQSWKATLFMMSPTGKRVMQILVAQAAGHTLYMFKDKMSPRYQQMAELLRNASWAASATAMVELANVDKLFDMLVPEEARKILESTLPEVTALEERINEQQK